MAEPLLAVEKLHVVYHTPGGAVEVVKNLSFQVAPGETLAIVGESGSGKTATALATMGLLPANGRVTSGSIRLAGQELLCKTEREMEGIRGRQLAMVFQDPISSLNPVLSIGKQLLEALQLNPRYRHDHLPSEAVKLLQRVGISAPEERLKQYPHQLSGGIRQRVMLAMALAGHPKLLIADEPTTALDVTVKKQILHLLASLGQELNLATLLITHDLADSVHLAQRILVLYAGKTMEVGPAKRLLNKPRHPYTWNLLRAMPRLAGEKQNRLITMPGQPPDLAHAVSGCPLHPRCAQAFAQCREAAPPLFLFGEADHAAACWLHQENPSRLLFTLSKPEFGPKAKPLPPSTIAEAKTNPIPLLEVKNLRQYFPVGSFWSRRLLRALDGVSFTVREREGVAIVGESGCGKSTLWQTALGLYRPTEGEVLFHGKPLTDKKNRRSFHQKVGVVFQSPYSSLNPRMTIREIIEEPLRVAGWPAAQRRKRVAELLGLVDLSTVKTEVFPHQLSGGQRQRIAIARALATNPLLLIADEPVSSLDVSVQAQILNLLKDLQQSLGLSLVVISHDLALVNYIAQRVMVMYLGKVVETGPTNLLFTLPRHPYTQALVAVAQPAAYPSHLLSGEVPNPITPPSGCPFHPRCPQSQPVCRHVQPPLQEVGREHLVACHLAAGSAILREML